LGAAQLDLESRPVNNAKDVRHRGLRLNLRRCHSCYPVAAVGKIGCISFTSVVYRYCRCPIIERTNEACTKVNCEQIAGGIQINGLVASNIDSQPEFQNSTTLGGLNLKLHQRISRHYGRLERLNEVVEKKLKGPGVWRFEARTVEQIIEYWLAENPFITRLSPLSRSGLGVTRLKRANCCALGPPCGGGCRGERRNSY